MMAAIWKVESVTSKKIDDNKIFTEMFSTYI